ncbi:MAG: hypothetical protein R3C03_10965 [Pirellulaceae bacterium]
MPNSTKDDLRLSKQELTQSKPDLFPIMNAENRIARNLEKTSLLNSQVHLSLDQIVENAYDDHICQGRSDWPEIKRTVETFLYTSLSLDGELKGIAECDCQMDNES